MNRYAYQLIFAVALLITTVSCKDDILPKPEAHLALEYKLARYVPFSNNCPYTFDVNSDAILKSASDCNMTIDYPKMKATIYLNYKPVRSNIDSLLMDAQKLTFKHVVKADNIIEQPFINPVDRVFGMFYEVNGNAATNGRFYVTDSTRHFVECSVYFYAKPNFDSLLPAASYVKNDMQRLMETLRWK